MLKIVPSDGKVQGETGGGLGIRQYGPLKPLARATLGHSGATGNNRALLLFDPATGIVAAVTINQGSGHGESHFVVAPVLLQAAIEFATQH
jgi:CubicO group peptidase (beta-lactamase class C family)